MKGAARAMTNMPRRPILSSLTIVVALWISCGPLLQESAFAAPKMTSDSMKKDTIGSFTRSRPEHLVLRRASASTVEALAPRTVASTMLSMARNPLNIAVSLTTGCFLSLNPWAPQNFVGSLLGSLAVAGLLRLGVNKIMGKSGDEEEGSWDGRRFWMGLNVGNHAIYAALFVIRSIFYPGGGGSDRPFFYESYFLGWLCGPSFGLPTVLGWPNHQYNQPMVLKWMKAINAPSSTAYPAFITKCIGDPSFMYFYQIAEGIFHLMIVFGGLRLAFGKGSKTWPPSERSKELRLFRWGLWLELVIMDISYVTAFSCLPFLSVPGHFGLTTIMMLIHHVNVLPDVMCGWYEWRAAKRAKAIEANAVVLS